MDLYQKKYLKYKAKYMLMKMTQSGGNLENTISIGNFDFTVLSKGFANDRDHVLIESKNKESGEISKFVCYRSLSESGIWRVCIFTGGYVKGINYIVSSFVNMDLQNKINQIYNSIQNEENIIKYCHIDKDAPNKSNSEKLMQIINDNNRFHLDPIFNTLSKCSPGVCFNKHIGIIENLLAKRGGPTYEYEAKLKDIIKSKKLSQSIMHPTKEQDIKIYYDSMSTYLSEYFKLKTEIINQIGTFEFKFGTNITFKHNFYSVVISNTVLNLDYNLYFSKYEYINNNNTTFNGIYYTVLNVIPIDSNTNQFGLYEKIISAGVYIYKIMDYRDQVGLDSTRNIELNDGTIYQFFGDLVTDVWPLNIIKQKI